MRSITLRTIKNSLVTLRFAFVLIVNCLSAFNLPMATLNAQGTNRNNAETQNREAQNAVTKPNAVTKSSRSSMIPFYIGTYTSGISKGIHRCVLNSQTGALQEAELVAELENPSFLTIHPRLNVLYACSEIRRDGKREGAQLMAYKIGSDGKLTAIGGQPSGGAGPCYVSTDQTGKVALVANYGSGSIASLPIAADGSLGAIVTNVQHTGKSVNPGRQEGPHAHCILTDPSNRFACAVDLGLDQVLIYELDVNRAKLAADARRNFHTKPGTGPRHLAFHPDGKHVFIIHELANVLVSARWDAAEGKMTELASVSTLPEGYSSESSTAEVLVHPNGKFVYGSNRGHDSIVVFAFDAKTGNLNHVAHTPTGGKSPRNFRLDPTGQFLLAANQNSDSIVAFQIDSENSGKLTQVGETLKVGAPCCIKFVSNVK